MNAFIRPIDTERIFAHSGEGASSGPLLFLIGRNSHGNWVAQDQSGHCGGLFIGRAQALKFALSENGNRPDAVVMVPGALELGLMSNSQMPSLDNWDEEAHRQEV